VILTNCVATSEVSYSFSSLRCSQLIEDIDLDFGKSCLVNQYALALA